MPCTATGLRAAISAAISMAPFIIASLSAKTRLQRKEEKCIFNWTAAAAGVSESLPDQAAALGFVSVHLPGRQRQLVHQAGEKKPWKRTSLGFLSTLKIFLYIHTHTTALLQSTEIENIKYSFSKSTPHLRLPMILGSLWSVPTSAAMPISTSFRSQ